ncbi:MAG TPA: AbrB/MazE/SpoVT family DNA-binding domain-containing protein [Desulfurococcaceae archaeon]|nr:AbrB/MazE/SpoVT family DNA-binding domain-containing protein [Desulfurococcaceae archaeon]
MVRLKVKVGPKGQIVIPKMFREAYRIKENGYAIIEPTDKGLLIKGIEEPDEIVKWIRERRKSVKCTRIARLGDLVGIDLEEEFET